MSIVRLSFLKSVVSALLLITLLAAPGISSAWADENSASGSAFSEGVRLYREGHYAKALDVFEKIHKDNSTDINATYYLAITSAQLGRFKQARGLYEQILLLDPNGKAAQLARDGMKYLPDSQENLDLPPRFQAVNQPPAITAQVNAQSSQAPPVQTNSSGMSPQDLQAIQMMMMMGGGNNNGMGGMNPMGSMMPMMGGNNMMGGMQGMDPNIMSTMMMNQMMQNFDLSGGPPGGDQ